jgi:dihydrofolate reductase
MSAGPQGLTLVAAMDERRVIGRDGGLPWRLPNDLAHFKRLTLGRIVLMGRKTWQSLGRPLPQRDNWVLTRDRAFKAEGARVFHDLVHALDAPRERPICVIGGADLFAQTLPLASTLELTCVHADVGGDTFFPEHDAGDFEQVAREDHPADERHAHSYSFVRLVRRI